MASISPSAPAVLHDYYRVLTGGAAAYGRGEELRPLLSEHLEVSGSLAGHRLDATQGFLMGVSGFIGTVQEIEFLREVHTESSSAVLYDASMPGGTVRFAEFFTYGDVFAGGARIIDSLFLHYDGPDYTSKGGR